jgi:small-conductance mechanosensitive channel
MNYTAMLKLGSIHKSQSIDKDRFQEPLIVQGNTEIDAMVQKLMELDKEESLEEQKNKKMKDLKKIASEANYAVSKGSSSRGFSVPNGLLND